jgi:hypothetical protein
VSEIESNPTPESTPAAKPGLSNAVLAVVAVLILAILGGGGWLVYDKVIKSDSASAPLPATVLPASTLAVATVNANPSLSQKVDLFNVIHKFPALKSKVNIGAQDDPRKWVIDQILKSDSCPSVSFDKDFAPWLGNHFALGAVKVGSAVAPVAALETSNGAAATTALNKMVACNGTKDFIFTVTGAYVVASDSKAHLDTIVGEAKTKPLSADAGYQKWTGKVGGDGIVTMYAAKDGIQQLTGMFSDVAPGRVQNFKTVLSDFTGAAGSLSATSDGLELKLAIGSKALTGGATTLGSEVAALPSDTALVAGLGMSPAMSSQLSKSMTEGFSSGLAAGGGSAPTPAEVKAMIKQYTGLAVPADIITLLGKAIVLSVGGNAPADLTTIQSPFQLPVGLKINGDAAKIRAVIAKVEATVGGTLSQMGFATKTTANDFVLATNQSYANAITGFGSLGTDPEFMDAVPNAANAQGIFFLRIDSAWRTAIINLLEREGMPNASEVAANTAPLAAVGLANWTEGDAGIVDVKLTTK